VAVASTVALLTAGTLFVNATRSNGVPEAEQAPDTTADADESRSEVTTSMTSSPSSGPAASITTTAATTPMTPTNSTTTAVDEEAPRTFYVSPDGSDDAMGAVDDPFESLETAFERLEPGDTLLVREGVYREDVRPSTRPGSFDAPITVEAFPGERPVVEGLLWLREPSFWRIRGINVTWSDDNSRRKHMVKITGGRNWEFTDAEVWGARSYAAILVAGEPEEFVLARLFVHDTFESNDDNQDHLIYLNSGTGGGVVEHCLLVRSENGRGIKLGGTERDSQVSNVVIRFNTFFDNLGPSNVQLSYGASGNRIERNIFVRPGGDGYAVTSFRLSGTDNVVADNLAWEAAAVIEPGVTGLVDGGGNFLLDPEFGDPEVDNFRPEASAARAYGYLGAAD
jgi:hypothetical protein